MPADRSENVFEMSVYNIELLEMVDLSTSRVQSARMEKVSWSSSIDDSYWIRNFFRGLVVCLVIISGTKMTMPLLIEHVW